MFNIRAGESAEGRLRPEADEPRENTIILLANIKY